MNLDTDISKRMDMEGTRDTPTPRTSSTPKTLSTDRTEKSSESRRGRKLNFRTVARLVKWSTEAAKNVDRNSPKHIHDWTQGFHKEHDEQSGYELNMRRSTVADVTRNARRRSSTTAQRQGQVRKQSVGSVVKDMDKSRPSISHPRSNSSLLSMAVREEVQKRRLMSKFKFIVRLGLLVHRWWKKHSHSEVSQTHPFYMQYQMINDLSQSDPDNAIQFKASYFKANKQMRMSQEARRILTMEPEERSKEEVYYAMIALRGIDCIADYPLRMQEALARHGMFQSFDPKRIIVKQGHPPLYFYFILYGTVVVATLDTGEPYAKTRVTLRRGENFGELAIAHRIPRQSTVLTMEYTEFLTIDCDTYENIFMAGGVKTIHDPDHNNFMRSMYFLRDWPLEKLQSNPKALEFCYFRRNTVMVKDSNMSDWIYIVKSGSLRVYKKLQKCYPTVNRRTGNYTELANTDGYHCFMSQESEYHRYAMYNHVPLPPPLSPDTDSDEEDHTFVLFKTGGIVEEKENLLALPLLQRVERLIRPRTATGGVIETYGHSKFSKAKRNIQSAKSDGNRLQMTASTPRADSSFSTPSTADISLDIPTPTPEVPSGKRTLMDDFESSARMKKKEITAADLDPEFVLVQTLTKGQAFGVQHTLLENQPSLILVSGGAECVMLNKKFYKEQIDPNMMQNLKQQISPFPTDEELQENLQIRVNWLKYKKITLEKLRQTQQDGKPPKQTVKNRRLVFK
ncbi:uncharacterized protein LOC132718728 isoform X2 [Ruditapes philippinarum]|uniref:uncharacterized protein LOC132718728 isoform X2 n=1 Tax=Ruditapes philippinarum TaxID=129788 RepID=UPI00295B1AA4|nr:uncharacterized protein LOC132718728 isoform X2 [Ruditapes philippinarum]